MNDEVAQFAQNFKTLDDLAKIHGIERKTLPSSHPDAVYKPDYFSIGHGAYLESDIALMKRVRSSNPNLPRYSFGDVNGIMKAGIHVVINDDLLYEMDISFDYFDRRDGKKYHVEGKGFRTLIPNQEPNGTKG